MLLAFDLSASLLYRCRTELLDPINRLSLRAFERPADFFLFLRDGHRDRSTFRCGSISEPGRWFEFGPFSVQASRVLLYAAYFFIGAGIGAANFDRGLLGADGRLAKSSWGWVGRDARSLLRCCGC